MKKTKKIVIIIAVVLVIAIAGPLIAMQAKSSQQAKNAVLDGQQRVQAAETLDTISMETLEGQIEARLIESWANWKPGYEDWLEWSNDLYAGDAVIDAIGGEQAFRDYQESMRHQREKFTMEMGPIDTMDVKDNVAVITYNMYLTSKSFPKQTIKTVVTEINTFEEIDGKLVVIRLDLSTKRN